MYSQSVLQAIISLRSEDPYVQDLAAAVSKEGALHEMKLQWAHTHVWTPGNEHADTLAKPVAKINLTE